MTLASIPLMDRTGRRTLHLYGLGGMFIFSIFITISFLIKASLKLPNYTAILNGLHLKIDKLIEKRNSLKICSKLILEIQTARVIRRLA